MLRYQSCAVSDAPTVSRKVSESTLCEQKAQTWNTWIKHPLILVLRMLVINPVKNTTIKINHLPFFFSQLFLNKSIGFFLIYFGVPEQTHDVNTTIYYVYFVLSPYWKCQAQSLLCGFWLDLRRNDSKAARSLFFLCVCVCVFPCMFVCVCMLLTDFSLHFMLTLTLAI